MGYERPDSGPWNLDAKVDPRSQDLGCRTTYARGLTLNHGPRMPDSRHKTLGPELDLGPRQGPWRHSQTQLDSTRSQAPDTRCRAGLWRRPQILEMDPRATPRMGPGHWTPGTSARYQS
uniref:Uncharacterized protein n=1 Tax=Rousettus aegyptiacus TaxID=9407 RepID=A0A7J8BSF3_ROUAE|nr:hypothetical protein HJG63_009544 [Rousettus aegyptiacus]